MKNLMISTIVASLYILSVSAIKWKDCGSVDVKVASVIVSGCEKTDMCPLPRNQNATVTVKFHTNTAFSKATAVVHGILGGIPVPFPIHNPDGCKDSGLTCPVAAGSDDTYSTQIFVKEVYPKVRVVVKWELKDENNKDIFCMELPAQIVDGQGNKASSGRSNRTPKH